MAASDLVGFVTERVVEGHRKRRESRRVFE